MSLSFKQLSAIAKEYGVIVQEQDDSYGRNGGACSGREIYLYPCDEDWILELSFWHELGHILTNCIGRVSHSMSTVSSEGAAWEIGLRYASNHNRTWDYDSKEMTWARKCLASYVGGEYDELQYERKDG